MNDLGVNGQLPRRVAEELRVLWRRSCGFCGGGVAVERRVKLIRTLPGDVRCGAARVAQYVEEDRRTE